MRAVIVRSIVAALVVITTVVSAAPVAAAPPATYHPPVDAPVVDPFRPPATPYGPGNRGIEYGTASGAEVRVAADGVVAFAGYVAREQWVTVRHDGGVRTTYGPLTAVPVAAGAEVHQGDVIGRTTGALTFTARLGDGYIDPALLLAAAPPRVHLVPEPLDIPQYRFEHHGIDVPGVDALRSAIDWETRHLLAVPQRVIAMTPLPVLASGVDALANWHAQRDHCTSWYAPPARLASRHVAVLVGGLGSSSDNAAIADLDTAALGYRDADVVRFSYAGGRVPPTTPSAADLAGLPSAPYGARDTVGDLVDAGHRLAALLAAVVDATPAAVPVDVHAHSQGGLVARVALDELARTRPDVLRRLGTVVTLGTPHHGADLAAVVAAARGNPAGQAELAALGAATDLPLAPDDAAVRQLAPDSDLFRSVLAGPPPAGVRVVSIAARGDVVVPSPRAHLDGAENVVVPVDGPTAHDRLPGSGEATREVALALAGAPPTCETAVDAVLDATGGTMIMNLEQLVAAAHGG